MKLTLGAYIEERRKEIKLNKKELANSAGLSRQGLYKILNGDVGQVQLSTVFKLSFALRLHPIVLMKNIFKNWEFPNIETKGALLPKSATGFIGDVTYPDNSIVITEQEFTKVWRSQNIGDKDWENCFLKCFDRKLKVSVQDNNINVNDNNRGLIPQSEKIALPTVKKGEVIDLSVRFTAPPYPCTVISYWKLVDKNDNLMFPKSEGLSCLVQVVAI